MTTSRPGPFEAAVDIAAAAGSVHELVTTLAGVRGWWSPVVTGSLEQGGAFHVGFAGLDETITLTVAKASPDQVEWLVRGHSSAPDWAGSRISFALEQRSTGCGLALRHTGVPPEQVAPGWDHFLGSLRLRAETGVGRPYPWAEADPLAVALRYHDAWTGRRFDEAVGLLADDLSTEVPINAYSSRAEWAQALVGFASIVDRADLVSAVGGPDEATLVYDMHTGPFGVLRIAENFTVRDGQIRRIRHVHDTVALREAATSAVAD